MANKNNNPQASASVGAGATSPAPGNMVVAPPPMPGAGPQTSQDAQIDETQGQDEDQQEEGEEANVKKIEDGVNPNAPNQPVSLAQQIEAARGKLDEHRKQLNAAKRQHESNLERVQQLRKTLASAEGNLANNRYENLLEEESQLMAQLQRLEVQVKSRTSTGMRSR
jgi:chromosome segregation ATPase